MREFFAGRISAADAAPASAPAADADTLAVTHLACGYLYSRGSVDMLIDDNLVCIARGTPRFADSPASRHGATARRWVERFRQHGDTAASAARGRFSVVVIDTRSRSVWMATDRFATWPLCYRHDSSGFGFSDRADRVPGGSGRLSAQAIHDYLFFHAIPAPATIFADVQRLPAAHSFTWRDGRLECCPWWTPTFGEPGDDDLAGRKKDFLRLIEDAVEREARGAETGAFLSGGTDSSTVSGMLCRVQGRPARTYSIGFDAEGYDEMAYARIAARRFGTDHHEYYVSPGDLLEGIPHVAVHYDQPFGNSSAVPAWICAQRARDDGITRMLAGDGGDELFGGNVRYAKQRIFAHYGRVPGPIRKLVVEPMLGLPAVGRIPMVRKGRSYVEQAKIPMPDRLQMYNLLRRLGPTNVFSADFLSRVDQDAPLAAQRTVWQAAGGAGFVNRMLAFDWKYTLADNDLPKVIGTTRLAGVDVGFPLLSDELVEFSLNLPPEWKLKGLTLRWFFKEALRGFLPDEIIAKKKHGFGLPFGVWACQHDGLKALAADALGSFKTRGFVRTRFIDDLLAIHLPAHPGYYGEMVWILMMMEFWMRQHADARLSDL